MKGELNYKGEVKFTEININQFINQIIQQLNITLSNLSSIEYSNIIDYINKKNEYKYDEDSDYCFTNKYYLLNLNNNINITELPNDIPIGKLITDNTIGIISEKELKDGENDKNYHRYHIIIFNKDIYDQLYNQMKKEIIKFINNTSSIEQLSKVISCSLDLERYEDIIVSIKDEYKDDNLQQLKNLILRILDKIDEYKEGKILNLYTEYHPAILSFIYLCIKELTKN